MYSSSLGSGYSTTGAVAAHIPISTVTCTTSTWYGMIQVPLLHPPSQIIDTIPGTHIGLVDDGMLHHT